MAEFNGIKRGNNFKDITEVVSGRLTAIRFSRMNKQRQAVWLCRCSCGTEKEVASRYVISGHTRSCGCLKRDEPGARTHGMSHTAENAVWRRMKIRCVSPKSPDYKDYGGRGITVCDRWATSFEAFFEDMGTRPSSRHSIEREDVNGNYEPSNCVWATAQEQARNRRTTTWFVYHGDRRCLTEHCQMAGKSQRMVWKRLRRGWSIEEALETPSEKARGEG